MNYLLLPSGTVTFLFTDIEGSTKLAQQYRADWETWRNRHHTILRTAIEMHRGHIFQVVGDAFCASFHITQDAVQAAVKAQIDLNAETWGHDVRIKVRMAIHGGQAEIQENGEYQGYLAMSRTQRLLSAAHGGQILVSGAAEELIRDDLPHDVALRDMGYHRLKDFVQPEHIYQLMGPGLPSEFPPLKTSGRIEPRPTTGLVIRLMGAFDIRVDGKPIHLSARNAQSLLAYLILNAGTPHRREKLAGMFWPDTTEEKARAYLRHELWRIRKALSTGSKVDYLLVNELNVSFNSSAEYWLDAAVLKNLAESASPEELMNALAAAQGELLPGFYDEWVVIEREHLGSVYEQKMARLLALLEKEKRWHEIVEWAERWVAWNHGSEAAYQFLMIAYDALGDRAKVAGTYDRCVLALHELDLEPSEQTRTLAFKRTSKLNIPVPMTSFIGREQELKDIAGLISQSRLVTLTGAGGVGKTRVAIQVVADVLDLFPDGVWFVDLAPLLDSEFVPQTVCLTLGLSEQPERSAIQALIDFLKVRRTLLILDNCEHLIGACAGLADALLQGSAHLHILSTSREALRIAGEIPYRMPSLDVPRLSAEHTGEGLANTDSVRLFLERAELASPEFIKNPEKLVSVALICQRLDGIPLAIELAAARVNVLTVEQILKRLDDRFNLLTRGLRSTLPRHQTLRAMIEWSYDLLSEKERILFRRLAVFAGGWTLEAAEEVCSGSGIEISYILDLISQLVNKSLVIVEIVEDKIRYHRLETIRQFGREKLIETTEAGRLHDKHLAYFLDLAEQADKRIHRPDQVEWMDRLETEIDNFRAALEWCVSNKKTELALRLLGPLSWAWGARGYFREFESWFGRIRVLPKISEYPALYARLLNYIGREIWLAGDFRQAQSVLEESQAIWLKLGVDGEIGFAEALEYLGDIALHEENIQAAQSYLEQSFKLYQKHGDEWGMATVIFDLGNLDFVQGHYAEAEQQSLKSLAKFQALGDKGRIALVLSGLGELARFLGDYDQAGKYWTQNLENFRALRYRHALAWPFLGLAWVSLHEGNYQKAKGLFEESLKLSRENANKALMTLCLAGFASLLGMISRLEQAARLFGAVEFLSESLSRMEPADQKEFDYYVGVVHEQLDQAVFAKAWAEGRAMTMEQAIDFALAEINK